MKRTRVIAAAFCVLAVAGSKTYAQGDHGDHGKHDDHQQPQRPVTQAEQHQRAIEEQQRTTQYRQQLDNRVHVFQQQTQALDAQKRAAAIRAQQEYAARLQQQQEHLRVERNIIADPYITTPRSFRYTINGNVRETNQFGVDVLRSAVNNGYDQGYRAGAADRADHWRSNYQSSAAYQDANFGYEGSYIDQSDYNYYFRQGFQRGYQDGYNNRYQYGAFNNGTRSILGNVLTSILGLAQIR